VADVVHEVAQAAVAEVDAEKEQTSFATTVGSLTSEITTKEQVSVKDILGKNAPLGHSYEQGLADGETSRLGEQNELGVAPVGGTDGVESIFFY
jgi:hypothetical protein